MTNNRKPVDEVRLSWDAEAAFKRLNDKQRHHAVEPHEYIGEYKIPYTPPPNVAAWLQAQADKPKGRDYEAILRAAKKKPVGYYEDAPTGIKFGGQPLPSASTKPHGKDVDTADGPWPKWLIADTYIRRFDGPMGGCMCYYRSGRAHPDPLGGWGLWNDDPRVCTQSEAAQWLEAHGHKDVAAQLRGKGTTPPRDDVETGGGRVYLESKWWYRVRIGDRVWFKRHPDNQTPMFEHGWHEQHYGGCMEPANADECIRTRGGTELFGPEKDAILAECRKAMGL